MFTLCPVPSSSPNLCVSYRVPLHPLKAELCPGMWNKSDLIFLSFPIFILLLNIQRCHILILVSSHKDYISPMVRLLLPPIFQSHSIIGSAFVFWPCSLLSLQCPIPQKSKCQEYLGETWPDNFLVTYSMLSQPYRLLWFPIFLFYFNLDLSQCLSVLLWHTALPFAEVKHPLARVMSFQGRFLSWETRGKLWFIVLLGSLASIPHCFSNFCSHTLTIPLSLTSRVRTQLPNNHEAKPMFSTEPCG